MRVAARAYTLSLMYTHDREKIVHARLDAETGSLLERLRRQTGLQDSELVRRAIRALARRTTAAAPRVEIVGVGAFASGVSDLGSSKAHLAGFGRV